MHQAIITLLLKKEKNPLCCGFYRPISLLNTDAKILAKVLAKRLEKVIPTIVSPDQTGFVKNRHSFFNIRRLFNILYTPTQPGHKDEEVVISLDAEKAFDRVEWDYLFRVLDRFKFGSKFISWIRLLYSFPLAAVRTNNNISSYFQLQRGTRQGCPLSPLLFVVAIEPLAIAVRQSLIIKGLKRLGVEHKVSLYAHDALLFISNPLSSIPALLDLLDKFGKLSGYKVNLQKSETFPLTTLEGNLSGTMPFKCNCVKFKYLGIWVTRNFKDLYKANYLPLLLNLKQDIARWDLLPLSLGGKINLVKMIILPKFLYLFQSVPIFLSKSFFSNLEGQISSFIWDKKHPRICKKILQLPRNLGGMSLPNFMYYYWAANSRAVLYWLSEDVGMPSWVILEKGSIRSSSPIACVLNYLLNSQFQLTLLINSSFIQLKLGISVGGLLSQPSYYSKPLFQRTTCLSLQ